MLDDRNRSSHLYDEKTSEEIFLRIKDAYVDLLKKIIVKLKEKNNSDVIL